MPKKIEFSPDAAQVFALLDGPAKQRMADVLSAIAGESTPTGRRVASGEPPAYRVRMGSSRILYEWAKGVLRVMDVRIERRVGREG